MTTKPPAKKQPGRPRTGRTPDKVRSAKTLANLKQAGGRQVRFNLQPEGAAQLDAIMATEELNQTDALHWAIARAAKRLPKG